MLSTKSKLIDEINNHLEHGGVPLSSIVRKAARLAQVCQEHEHRLLFDMHLNGLDVKQGEKMQVQGWPNDGSTPRWDIVEALVSDRRTPDEKVKSSSLEDMEFAYETLNHPQFQTEPTILSKLVESRRELTLVFTRIRNRVMSFVRLVENTAESDIGSAKLATLVISAKVFIGHGRSTVWKDLKELISDRLKLPYDEFNREPTAGISTKERLETMLNQARFAFLIMSAEDEYPDGTLHARENVIHEVGLFQGRLGFSKAIVLMEEGCEEFSNIRGLTQIRFPKGNIGAISEEIRRVLEREGILSLDKT